MKRLGYLLVVLICLQACQKDNSANFSNGSSQGAGGGSGTGQGGSLARFTIAQNHLYVVDNKELYAYSLANSEHPQLKSNVHIGFDIETIYSYKDKLFVGSQNAMYIYSVADPAKPELLGQASHVRACDPVVASDTIAYVTVRSGNTCGGNANSLLVYDVSNVLNPVQLNTVNMSGPWGLGLKGNRLYVCDGNAGLVVYDLSNPVSPKLVRKITGEKFLDVIPTNDLLIAMVEGGTALYGYEAGDNLKLLAKVSK